MGQIYSYFTPSCMPNYTEQINTELSLFLITDVCSIVGEYVGIICNKCEHIERKITSEPKNNYNFIHWYNWNAYTIDLLISTNNYTYLTVTKKHKQNQISV